MPTVSTPGIKQKFPIPLSARNRAGNHIATESERAHRVLDFGACELMQLRIAHDSPFPNLAALQLKLRLDEDYHLAIPGEQARQRGHNHGPRDEADLSYGDVDLLRHVFTC